MSDYEVDLDFLIFAHARSGSDNLLTALNRHPEVMVCEEPFNPKHQFWEEGNVDYHSKIVDEASLYAQIACVRERYTGIKTLDWNLSTELNGVLLRDTRVPLVLLRRRNALQAVISHWLARASHVWQVWDVDESVGNRYQDLPELSVETVRELMDEFWHAREAAEEAVANRPQATVLRVWYEDLYTGSSRERAITFAGVTEFLHCSELSYDQVEDILGPRGKLNSSSTYLCIPNAQELNEVFGSDETGWLL